jgi:hypothetical protein
MYGTRSFWFQGLAFTGIWVIGHEVRRLFVPCASAR